MKTRTELIEITTDDTPLLCVEAEPRYWEDATFEGHADKDGTLAPFRRGELWCPIINLLNGSVFKWPGGEASIHYKVCDQGQYCLCDRGLEWYCSRPPDQRGLQSLTRHLDDRAAHAHGAG